MTTFKKFNLTKQRDGERNSSVIFNFYGENINDQKMLEEADKYLRIHVRCSDEDYENAIGGTFDGSGHYDVYSYNLEEVEEEEEEEEE